MAPTSVLCWKSGVLPKLLLAILLLLPLTAAADVYQWTDSQGRVHFSDKPMPGAKKRHNTPLNTIENPAYNLQINSMQIRFSSHNGSMLVNGRVSGVPMRFIVDTGASVVTIPPSIAKRAGISTEGARTVTLKTANGEVAAPLVSIPTIEVDGVIQSNVQATVHQVASDDASLGLLGMSFFSRYNMRIDHDRKIIHLEKK